MMGADIALTLISIPAIMIASCVCYYSIKFCFAKPRGNITRDATDVDIESIGGDSSRESESDPVNVPGNQLPTYSDLFPSLTIQKS